MKIGVFDSGVGGLSVANAIEKALPGHEIIYREDREHVPYGTRNPAQILEFVTPIFQQLIAEGCQVIVVACNTVTTTLIEELRAQFPQTRLIAMEPMVKPAAELTKTGVIAVCATPATLHSARYKWLKQQYAAGVKVLEPDCSDWAYMIEHKQIEEKKIAKRISKALKKGADVIVLGCTHYHWIEDEIKAITAGRALVIQPEPAVIGQLQAVIASLGA
jgi:glutamate racemase